jgi:hypothetical protein
MVRKTHHMKKLFGTGAWEPEKNFSFSGTGLWPVEKVTLPISPQAGSLCH